MDRVTEPGRDGVKAAVNPLTKTEIEREFRGALDYARPLLPDGVIGSDRVEKVISFGAIDGNRFPAKLYVELWRDLRDQRYWDAIPKLKQIQEHADRAVHLNQERLPVFTRTFVDQIFCGWRIAAGFPIHSDLWTILANPEKSCLAEYVTDVDYTTAVNTGFWNTLRILADPVKRNNAQNELGEILRFLEFDRYFNFSRGVEEAQTLPDEGLVFEDYAPINRYLPWVLYFVSKLGDRLDSEEKITRITAQLAAPLVGAYIRIADDRDKSILAHLAAIAKGPVLREPAMQRVFEDYYRLGIRNGFEGYDVDGRMLARVRKLLADPASIEVEIWNQLTAEMGITRESVNALVVEFVPESGMREHAGEIRRRVESEKQLDIEDFALFCGTEVAEHFAQSTHGKIRNVWLRRYMRGRKIMAGKKLERLSRLIDTRWGEIADQVNAFLTLDLLDRKCFPAANRIILRYSNIEGSSVTPAQYKRWRETLESYKTVRKRISLDSDAHRAFACAPYVNGIPALCKAFPDLFELTEG